MILKVADFPAANVSGSEGEAIEKHLSVIVALSIVTVALPELVATRVADLLEPGTTVPKSTLLCAIERTPFEAD